MNVAIDRQQFRNVLGHYPTGVCVITAMSSGGSPVGMAVGTFTSVSLDPPLVAFLPDRTSRTWRKIASAGGFCVNVLAEDQLAICATFAARSDDKFAGIAYRASPGGAPIIEGVVAWIDCTLHAVHEAGDHDIVVGKVLALEASSPQTPLLFHRGAYGRIASMAPADG